jgi:predicted phosphoribosyltransferase
MFADRSDAAEQLAERVVQLKECKNLIVLGIPRGGLPIAAAIARTLQAPLGVMLVKKIGAPYNEELAIGAATPAAFFLNNQYHIDPIYVKKRVKEVQELLKKRARLYHQISAAPSLANKTVLLVDDGVATGHTMHAAIVDVKQQHPSKIVVATPVISPEAKSWLQKENVEVISIITPANLSAIGTYYQHFEQVSDEEAVAIVRSFKKEEPAT